MVGNVFLKPISRLLKLTRQEGKVIGYGGKRELLAQCSAWLNRWLVNLCMNTEKFLYSHKIQWVSSGDEEIE